MTDPTRALAWMIGLPSVRFLWATTDPLARPAIHVETTVEDAGCPSCGAVARVKDRALVELVDLPLFGRPARLVWHKRRWACPDAGCTMGTWTEEDAPHRAPPARC